MSISLLRQLLMKEAVKKSAGSSGIMTINKNIARDVEQQLQKYISSAQSQGVDLDTLGPEQLKMIVELNKPKPPQLISASSAEGQDMTKKLMSFLDRQSGDNVVDITGKTIDTSQGIMGGKSVKELMDSGQVTKGARGMKKNKKIQDREMFQNSNLNETDDAIKARLDAGNKKSVKKMGDNRQMNKDELEDFELEIGSDNLEAYDFDGTVGSGKRILKEEADYKAEMFAEYKSIGGSKRPGGPKASERDRMPIRLMKNFEKELNEVDLMAEGYSKDQANVLIKARKKMTSGDEMNPNESLTRVKEEFADEAGVDVDDFTDIDFEIDIPEYAKGGRAGYAVGNQVMPAVDARMQNSYDYNVRRNNAQRTIERMSRDYDFSGLSSLGLNPKTYDSTPGPMRGLPAVGNARERLIQDIMGKNQTSSGSGNQTSSGSVGAPRKKSALELKIEENRRLVNEYTKNNPGTSGLPTGVKGLMQTGAQLNTGTSTSAPEPAYVNKDLLSQLTMLTPEEAFAGETFDTLSDLDQYNFAQSFSQFQPQLRDSSYVSPYGPPGAQQIFNRQFGLASGGRAGYYGGGMTNMVEPDLSDIGHGTDSLNARTRVMSPGSQATTSTGLNYLLGEDNDNTRVPFAMGKRAFLKFMGAGAAGIAGVKTGLFGLGKKEVAKKVVKEAATGSGAPPAYFLKLVSKIKKLGDDITETGAIADRQKVKQYKDYTLTEDVSTGRQEIQRMKVSEEASYYDQPLTEETYMSYTPGENIIGKGGKPIKTASEYDEGTAFIRSDRGNAGDIVDESTGISDDIFREVGEELPEAVRKTKAGDIINKAKPGEMATGGRITYSSGGLATMLGE